MSRTNHYDLAAYSEREVGSGFVSMDNGSISDYHKIISFYLVVHTYEGTVKSYPFLALKFGETVQILEECGGKR